GRPSGSVNGEHDCSSHLARRTCLSDPWRSRNHYAVSGSDAGDAAHVGPGQVSSHPERRRRRATPLHACTPAPPAPLRGGVATDLVNAAGGSLLHVYTSAIKGFAARLSAPAAAALEGNPLVAHVEADQVMRADVTQAMDANGDPWGLDRIDQGALPLSRTYGYTATGAGVHAYIIDTGIWTLHPEFGGRANNSFDALHLTGEDCNGHG